MKIADVLLLDFDTAISNARRTLERIPADNAAWKPNEKSMPIGKLAMHCATMPLFGSYIFEDDAMDLADPNSKRKHADLTFTTSENLLKTLDDTAAKCRESLASASDEHLSADWKFSFGEQLISHASRAKTYRQMCFDHLIHHTAQLGVYLRLLDIPVPGLYGPSADEPWAPKKS
ncbi:MAG: DinB family protein [Bryocella sp.]